MSAKRRRLDRTSQPDALDLAQCNLVLCPVVKFGCSRGLVSRHLLGVLQPSVIFQVNGDAGCSPGVTSHGVSREISTKKPRKIIGKFTAVTTSSSRRCRTLANDELRTQKLKRWLKRLPLNHARKHLHTAFALSGKIMTNSGQGRLEET